MTIFVTTSVSEEAGCFKILKNVKYIIQVDKILASNHILKSGGNISVILHTR